MPVHRDARRVVNQGARAIMSSIKPPAARSDTNNPELSHRANDLRDMADDNTAETNRYVNKDAKNGIEGAHRRKNS